MTPAIARGLRWVLTVAVVAFLVVFARTVDWTAAWVSIRGASLPLLLAAIVLNFATIAIKGIRWWVFLRPAGSPSLALAMRATIAGAGLNNVLVANGGDAARVVFVARVTGVPSSTVLATLALERLFDPVGFMVLLAYGAVAYSLPPSLEKWSTPALGVLAISGALVIWFVYSARNITPETARVPREEVPENVWGKVRAYVSGFARSTQSLTSAPRFVAALVLSMLAWVGQIYVFEFAAAAAHVSIPAAGSLATMLATNLGLVIRATPGNVGFFQFVYALTAQQFGVVRNDAIAVSLLIQTIQILPVTLIGIALAPEFIIRRKQRGDPAPSTTVT